MKPAPSNWPRVSCAIFYRDAAKAIDWLCKAFGFEVRLEVHGPSGRIEHSELVYGEGLIMVADAEQKRAWGRSPSALDGANTQSVLVYVDDVDAHCEHARAAGAKIETPPATTDYGEDFWSDRCYECVDLDGHHWWFCQRIRDVSTGA
jgi:uncharacterized glyoxalase superfamily protein PhnB